MSDLFQVGRHFLLGRMTLEQTLYNKFKRFFFIELNSSRGYLAPMISGHQVYGFARPILTWARPWALGPIHVHCPLLTTFTKEYFLSILLPLVTFE